MNKEFIPYEQALELKELNFDEMCIGKFIPYFSDSGWLLEINERLQYSTNSLLEQGFSAPLYQQAFRWFREKYDLYSYIEIRFESYEYYFYGYIIINRPFRNEYLTYEEAELECLKKLIEIVKNK